MKKISIVLLTMSLVLLLTGCPDTSEAPKEHGMFTDVTQYFDFELSEVNEENLLSFDDGMVFVEELQNKIEDVYPGLGVRNLTFPYQETQITKENMVRDSIVGDDPFRFSPRGMVYLSSYAFQEFQLYFDCPEMDQDICVVDNERIQVTGTNDLFKVVRRLDMTEEYYSIETTVYDFTNGYKTYSMFEESNGSKMFTYLEGDMFVVISNGLNGQHTLYVGDISTNDYIVLEYTDSDNFQLLYSNVFRGESLQRHQSDVTVSFSVSESNELENIVNLWYYNIPNAEESGVQYNAYYVDGWTHISNTSSTYYSMYNDEEEVTYNVLHGEYNGFDSYFIYLPVTETDVENQELPNFDGLTIEYDSESLIERYNEQLNTESPWIIYDQDLTEVFTVMEEWFEQNDID